MIVSLSFTAAQKWDAKLLPENLDFILIDGDERVNMRELSSWVAGNERLYIEVSSLPKELSIKSISPNPFNSAARIKFVLPAFLPDCSSIIFFTTLRVVPGTTVER